MNPYMAFAIEAAASTVKTSKEERQPRADPEKEPEPRTPKEQIVFEPVRHPHNSISGLVATLRSASPDQYGEISIPGVRVFRVPADIISPSPSSCSRSTRHHAQPQ
ncbi:hypothetical protein BQ8794_130058 [Mesorhizobium prunaredense]|uniref:Uncharacterized protein n=1 Tax=Mesorhizobium prunaredense TaxID=1631249 RepID=A0A1R3V5B0_9HYPH|nr:hypothetical protein BQ8794_130058 [Mesorhizobium prunaredense]